MMAQCKRDKVMTGPEYDMKWGPAWKALAAYILWVVYGMNLEVQPKGAGNPQNNWFWPGPKALAVWDWKEKLLS